LAKVINFNQIRKNLKNNVIEAVAISAANYSTGQNIIFVESKKPFENWYRVHRRSEKTRLKLKHVMASAAIPLLFPPVKIGCHFYGDGSLLNHTPISPAIHLGADRIMVIGVRQASVLEDDTKAKTVQPTVGRVFSLSLNALFMDALEADLERIKISNSCMRRIETLYIQPSRDIGEIASENASKLPGSVRYLVRGLGSMEEASELISYIMFEPEYCRKLIDLGYQDAIGRKEEIRDFLRC
jgi:NTE family protein